MPFFVGFVMRWLISICSFTYRKNGQPTSVVSYSCTRMSLRMAEDSEWESVMCDSPTANVAVCQHPWNTADQGQ